MTGARRPSLRWRKAPRTPGRAGWFEEPRYELRVDAEVLVTAQRCGLNLWFWYGLGTNTAQTPVTLDAVKAAAMEAARSYLASVEKAEKTDA